MKSTLSEPYRVASYPYGEATLQRHEYYLTSTKLQFAIESFTFPAKQLIIDWGEGAYTVPHLHGVNSVFHFDTLPEAVEAIESQWDSILLERRTGA